MLLLIIIVTFTCLVLAVMSVYWVFARPTDTVTARLETIDPAIGLAENNPMTVMAERVVAPLNRIVPISAIEAQKLQKQLMQAGYSSADATTVFRAIQIGLLIAIPTVV